MPVIQPPPYQDAADSQRWHEWYRQINALLSNVSISVGNIDDITITTPVAAAELLVWDGTSQWINQTGTEWGIVNDTTPVLGGDLDTGSFDIIVTDSDFVKFPGGNEILQWVETGGATHYFRLRNSSSATESILSLETSSGTANMRINSPSGGYIKVDNQVMGGTTAVTAATHTHANTERYLLCDTTSNAITVDLVAAATAGDGYRIDIKIVDATNAVTIDASTTETIDGSLTQAITNLYDNMSLVCDGSNWHII